ncbi:hypothetical protein D3C81_2078040 [compost metagenome]
MYCAGDRLFAYHAVVRLDADGTGDPFQQIQDRPAGAGGHHSDDRRQDRPERRFRYRAVAHPGDHLTGGIWLLLADGGVDRAGRFRALWPA